MPIFIGFSTQDVNQPRTIETTGAFGGPGTTMPTQPRIGKKYRLTDQRLVIRDLINALSIKQGDKVGQPTYGTTMWSYVFEPNISENREAMETEIRRVVGLDSRILLNNVAMNHQENGVMFELEVAFQPFNQPMTLGLLMERSSGLVSQVG